MTYLILGCGWIGEAFAQQLLREGNTVYATTTQHEKYQRLRSAGIFAIKADFDADVSVEHFPTEVDYVLTSIPAVKRLPKDHLVTRFDNVHRVLSGITYKKHIFLSSIGVYPDHNGVFTEAYDIKDSINNLYIAEENMLTLDHSMVFRLGGLFGGTRIFAKYFQDKICTTGGQLANFVHQDDVLQCIRLGFLHTLSSAVYNVVAPVHPLKKEVILASAAKYGYRLPSSFDDQDGFQKHVSGSKLQEELNYTFIYPSPLEF